MEPNNADSNQVIYREKQQLPNATAILVLGILSIVGCWIHGIPGLAMGIISLVLANNSEKLYKSNPGIYYEGSYQNLKSGRICAIVGISLSGLVLFISLIFLAAGSFTIFSAIKMLESL